MCIFHRKPSQSGKEKSVHLCSGLIDEDYNIIDVVHVCFCFFVMSIFKIQQQKKHFSL